MSMNTFDITTFRELKTYIACDLFRYMTSTSFRAFLRGWYIAGFRYTFFMRTTKYLACKGGGNQTVMADFKNRVATLFG